MAADFSPAEYDLEPDPPEYDLAALNAAIVVGRCWRLGSTLPDGRKWLVGDEADAARVPPFAAHYRVPAGHLVVLERVDGEPRALFPVVDVEAGGSVWRAGFDPLDPGDSLHVEHPAHGWTRVDTEARLARALAHLAKLPPDDGVPRRYLVAEREGWAHHAATTSWDAAVAASESRDPRVDVDEGVELVHAQSGWAWWSDGRLTTGLGLGVPRPRGLESDAAELIGAAWGSESGEPECGWGLLARVARVLDRESIARGQHRKGYARDEVERLRVELTDASTRDLWVRSSGHAEGYAFEVHEAMPDDWTVDARGRLVQKRAE